MNQNRKLIDSQVNHEHQFQKFISVSLPEVRQLIIDSHKSSNDLFEKKLKENQVTYRSLELPEASLKQYSEGLHEQ